jgi:hypothetical protein
MPARTLVLFAASAFSAIAQTVCQPTPAYSPCEITFELSAGESAANPNPYLTVVLDAEFRSPRFRTFRVPAFFDGGRRMVLRFSPTEPGTWMFHTTSNLKRFDGIDGQFSATESGSHGFVHPANVHHWAQVDELIKTPHLWMGDTLLTFPWIDRTLFQTVVDTRAGQKFNHLRGVLLSKPDEPQRAFASADQPNAAAFREIDDRVRYMNSKGIIADLAFAWTPDQIIKLFPSWQQRERYVRYLAARYSAMHVTWQLADEFESSGNGRDLLKEIGQTLKKLDPYQHPRSTGALATSSPLLGDAWEDYVSYGSSGDGLGAIEHQLDAVPFVNLRFGAEDSGAGHSGPGDGDADVFRRRLWNSTMDGQYPTFANAGTSGAGKLPVDAKFLDSPAAKQMSVWSTFFAGTRYWDLEPYFEVDGGRALALERPSGDEEDLQEQEQMEGVEYVVYVEKPGPVEVTIRKQTYDVEWVNPINGEAVTLKKFKGDKFSGEPPDRSHDWVLHISRESRKQSLRSYKFESRPVLMQEVEQVPQKVPYAIAEPASDSISLSTPASYAVKLTRDTKAMRAMMYLWTGEVPADQQGVRVIGAGAQGKFQIPANLANTWPANLAVRLYGMNGHGKVYMLLRVYQLSK